MRHHTFKIVLIITVMLSLVTPTFGETEKASNSVLQNTMSDMVVQANSKADYEKMATRYDIEVKRLLKNAGKHKQLALIYEQTEKVKNKTWRSNAARHCRIIAQKIQEVADETSALADLHRRIAKEFDK